MKKLIFSAMTAITLLLCLPTHVMAANSNPEKGAIVIPDNAPPQVVALLTRVNEIKAMKPATMNAAQKKAVRHELRGIKSELKDISGGVYISAGAIIVILILLILFT